MSSSFFYNAIHPVTIDMNCIPPAIDFLSSLPEQHVHPVGLCQEVVAQDNVKQVASSNNQASKKHSIYISQPHLHSLNNMLQM